MGDKVPVVVKPTVYVTAEEAAAMDAAYWAALAALRDEEAGPLVTLEDLPPYRGGKADMSLGHENRIHHEIGPDTVVPAWDGWDFGGMDPGIFPLLDRR